MTPTATTLTAVSKRYQRRGPWALDGVNLTLAPGTTTVVVGANGSGKSTLVRIATGVTVATRGAVTGRPAAVGYAPERLPADLRMTARVYLGHMARIRGLDEEAAGRAAEELFACFDLQPGPDVAIRTLSKGNNQKVALAQAFLAPTGFLALDEPMSGLDEQARARLWDLVERRRAQGSAVLVTSHTAVSDVRCDVAVGLAGGRVVVAAPGLAGVPPGVPPGVPAGVPPGVPPGVSAGAPSSTLAGAVRIEIDGPDTSIATLAARPGVVSTGEDGRVIVVTREEADAVLLWALQRRCSVVSVRPVEGGPAGGLQGRPGPAGPRGQ